MAETEAPITVTVKGDGQAPWVVVRADNPHQANERLEGIIESGLEGTLAVASRSLTETFAGAKATGTAVPTVVAGLDGQVVSSTPAPGAVSAPAPAPVPTSQPTLAGGASEVIPDRFGRAFEFNHPQAPQTPHGAAVLMHAKGRDNGRPYSQWLDPRSKKVPGNYEKGIRAEPLDPAQFENNGFARGVTWRGVAG